jgi:ubiquitin-conjugating enzyme E2 S
MNSRLAKDIRVLIADPPIDVSFDGSEMTDITNLILYLSGPESTPYFGGEWKLSLKIPPEYPSIPPKAYFLTKIFHPNVHPTSGEVCVDTLKRDWNSLTDLKQIVATIRCLLIEPNADSALNEQAGKLIQDDFGSFESTARIMTRIHARKKIEDNTVTETSNNETIDMKAPVKKKNKSGLKRL